MTAGLCPPWAGSCTRAWKGTSPKGADDFLVGIEDSGSWQKFTLVFWLLVVKGGGLQVQPRGHRWGGDGHGTLGPPWATAQLLLSKLPNASPLDENYLTSIQRTDNGLFSSQNTGRKVCEHQMCGLLFPSSTGDGNPHPAALKQGNKQPVLTRELHIA